MIYHKLKEYDHEKNTDQLMRVYLRGYDQALSDIVDLLETWQYDLRDLREFVTNQIGEHK